MEIQFLWLSYYLVAMLTNSVKTPKHRNMTFSPIPLLPTCVLPHNLFSSHVLFSVSTVILLYVSGISIAMENLKSCEPAWFHSIPGLTAESLWCAVRPQMYDEKPFTWLNCNPELYFCSDNKASRIDLVLQSVKETDDNITVERTRNHSCYRKWSSILNLKKKL